MVNVVTEGTYKIKFKTFHSRNNKLALSHGDHKPSEKKIKNGRNQRLEFSASVYFC